jgi:hypothetical protein
LSQALGYRIGRNEGEGEAVALTAIVAKSLNGDTFPLDDWWRSLALDASLTAKNQALASGGFKLVCADQSKTSSLDLALWIVAEQQCGRSGDLTIIFS